jgi:hypothetical protein
VDVVAFELKAIQRPLLLITGRVFTMATLTFEKTPESRVSNSTLFVSVI